MSRYRWSAQEPAGPTVEVKGVGLPGVALLLPLLLFSLACGGGEGADGAAGGLAEGGPDGEEHTDVVHVEPDKAAAWGIEVGPVGWTDVSAEVELPGVLTTNEDRTAVVGPLVGGQIARVLAGPGDRVQAGDVLAALNAPEYTQAQTGFLQAFAEAELSRKDYERARVLRNQQAIEEREFLRRQALYEQHLAALRSAEVILHSLGVDDERLRRISAGLDLTVPVEDHAAVEPLLALRAPIGGIVLERDAVLGRHVEPGEVLFTVSDLSVLWARLEAYEHQLPYLDPEAEAIIRSPLFPGRDFPGRITFISDKVDEELRTVRVRVEVPNPNQLLKPNMYVKGFLRVHEKDLRQMVVPPDAVQLLEGRHVVWVEDPPEEGEDHRIFRAVDVTLGEALTAGQIILSGLEGNEQLVVRGAFTLKTEFNKGTGAHDHVH